MKRRNSHANRRPRYLIAVDPDVYRMLNEMRDGKEYPSFTAVLRQTLGLPHQVVRKGRPPATPRPEVGSK